MAQKTNFYEDALNNPFLQWIAALWERKAVAKRGRDYLLQPLGGKRFGIGIDEDTTPVLGILVEDKEALLSVAWSSAAFIKNVQDTDWIALACKDVRLEGAVADQPVPLRLWIPIPAGVLDGFFTYGKQKTNRLRLRAMKKIGGRPTCARSVLKELPLIMNEKK